MDNQKINTVKKLNAVLRDLSGHIEGLDDTYSVCQTCTSRRYTSRVESLLAVSLKKISTKIQKDIEYLTDTTETQ